MLTVVKVGGGLAREAGPRVLRALCAQIAEAGARHPLLVVPGGAQFADVVRAHDRRFTLRPQTAHWMAILGMDQFGWALSDLIPGAARCTDLGSVGDRGVSILLPAALLAEHDPLPESWTVTSDSIAAWVARATRAPRLMLVKDVDGFLASRNATGDRKRLVRRVALGELSGVVDPYFARALDPATACWVVRGTRPGRVATLLATGRTHGTEVVTLGRSTRRPD